MKADSAVKVRKLIDIIAENVDMEDVGDKVKKGLRELRVAETEKGEALQAFSGVKERWEKTHGLNKVAMNMAAKVEKMNDAKRADCLRTLIPALEALLPDQLDIFADNAGGEDSKTPSEKKAKGRGRKKAASNVVPLVQ